MVRPDGRDYPDWRAHVPCGMAWMSSPQTSTASRGDELIASASDQTEYPTVFAELDPTTGDVRQSFFHFGDHFVLSLLDDFFGPGHPALAGPWPQQQAGRLRSSAHQPI